MSRNWQIFLFVIVALIATYLEDWIPSIDELIQFFKE